MGCVWREVVREREGEREARRSEQGVSDGIEEEAVRARKAHIAVHGLNVASSALREDDEVVEEVAVEFAPALGFGQLALLENLARPE